MSKREALQRPMHTAADQREQGRAYSLEATPERTRKAAAAAKRTRRLKALERRLGV